MKVNGDTTSSAEQSAIPIAPQVPSPEEEKIRVELQNIFLDLLTSAQELSYELATLDMKDSYTRDELKDLFNTAKKVVYNVKRMHRFLERHGRRKA